MSMDGNRLGDSMFDSMMAIVMDQNSGADEDIGRARMRALARAIVDEITSNATIGVLSTTSTPAGVGPHIHVPLTIIATGKIS